MTSDASRRFTDREVALVLRKASELEETADAGSGPGLTLGQLEEIATEVGIAPALIRRAVADLDAGRARSGLLSGGPLSCQALRAVAGELSRDGMARLMQHVESSSDQVGQVTEALGGTQWTARDRFRATQVSITPSGGETRVRVVERVTPRYRRLIHLLPPWVGFCLATAGVGTLNAAGAIVPAILASGAAAGAVVGRALWSRASRGSAARVERLAAELAREAEGLPRGPESEPSDDA